MAVGSTRNGQYIRKLSNTMPSGKGTNKGAAEGWDLATMEWES